MHMNAMHMNAMPDGIAHLVLEGVCLRGDTIRLVVQSSGWPQVGRPNFSVCGRGRDLDGPVTAGNVIILQDGRGWHHEPLIPVIEVDRILVIDDSWCNCKKHSRGAWMSNNRHSSWEKGLRAPFNSCADIATGLRELHQLSRGGWTQQLVQTQLTQRADVPACVLSASSGSPPAQQNIMHTLQSAEQPVLVRSPTAGSTCASCRLCC